MIKNVIRLLFISILIFSCSEKEVFDEKQPAVSIPIEQEVNKNTLLTVESMDNLTQAHEFIMSNVELLPAEEKEYFLNLKLEPTHKYLKFKFANDSLKNQFMNKYAPGVLQEQVVDANSEGKSQEELDFEDVYSEIEIYSKTKESGQSESNVVFAVVDDKNKYEEANYEIEEICKIKKFTQAELSNSTTSFYLQKMLAVAEDNLAKIENSAEDKENQEGETILDLLKKSKSDLKMDENASKNQLKRKKCWYIPKLKRKWGIPYWSFSRYCSYVWKTKSISGRAVIYENTSNEIKLKNVRISLYVNGRFSGYTHTDMNGNFNFRYRFNTEKRYNVRVKLWMENTHKGLILKRVPFYDRYTITTITKSLAERFNEEIWWYSDQAKVGKNDESNEYLGNVIYPTGSDSYARALLPVLATIFGATNGTGLYSLGEQTPVTMYTLKGSTIPKDQYGFPTNKHQLYEYAYNASKGKVFIDDVFKGGSRIDRELSDKAVSKIYFETLVNLYTVLAMSKRKHDTFYTDEYLDILKKLVVSQAITHISKTPFANYLTQLEIDLKDPHAVDYIVAGGVKMLTQIRKNINLTYKDVGLPNIQKGDLMYELDPHIYIVQSKKQLKYVNQIAMYAQLYASNLSIQSNGNSPMNKNKFEKNYVHEINTLNTFVSHLQFYTHIKETTKLRLRIVNRISDLLAGLSRIVRVADYPEEIKESLSTHIYYHNPIELRDDSYSDEASLDDLDELKEKILDITQVDKIRHSSSSLSEAQLRSFLHKGYYAEGSYIPQFEVDSDSDTNVEYDIWDVDVIPKQQYPIKEQQMTEIKQQIHQQMTQHQVKIEVISSYNSLDFSKGDIPSYFHLKINDNSILRVMKTALNYYSVDLDFSTNNFYAATLSQNRDEDDLKAYYDYVRESISFHSPSTSQFFISNPRFCYYYNHTYMAAYIQLYAAREIIRNLCMLKLERDKLW